MVSDQSERDNRYLEQSYDLLVTAYNDIPYPAVKSVQTIVDKIAENEPKAEARDAKSFVDDSLVKELEDSGFAKAVYGRQENDLESPMPPRDERIVTAAGENADLNLAVD